MNCRGDLELYELVHLSGDRAEGEEYGISWHAYISGLRVKETSLKGDYRAKGRLVLVCFRMVNVYFK